jgi:2-keto-4-pentenoate hydratase
VYRDGVETASTIDLQSLTGDFIDIVRHVADLLSVFGEKLRAGDIIIAGSIVPPIMSTTNEEIRFFLDPVDSISVNLVV